MPQTPEGIVRVWEQLESFRPPDLRLSAISAVLAKCLVFIGRLLVLARRQMTAVRPDGAMRCLLMHKFREGVFRLWNNFTEENENFTDLAFVRRAPFARRGRL